MRHLTLCWLSFLGLWLYCIIYSTGFELTWQQVYFPTYKFFKVSVRHSRTTGFSWMSACNADKYSNNGIVVSVPVSLYASLSHCQSALDACVKASWLSDLSLSTWWSTVGTMWTNIAEAVLLLLFLHWGTSVNVFTAGRTSLLILYYLGVNWADWGND